MSLICRLCLLALVIAVADSERNQHSVSPPSESKDKAARALVASLMNERINGASAKFSSSGIMQWIPASSLEAQQGERSHEEAEREIRNEFETVVGKDLISVFENDLHSIKKELQTTFMAIPKNEYGELGHTGVRYALHRLFVARHGWYIQGIDPEGDHFSESSPSEVLKGHVPDRVQRLIEKMLYGRGFGLFEVALLGALLENLIHQEAIKRVAAVYTKFDTALEKKLSSDEVDFNIDLYMAAYITGKDVTTMPPEELKKLYDDMHVVYPGWEETQRFTHKIRHDKYGSNDLTFNETVAVIIEIGEKHGTWQNRECVDMKKQLMDLEEQKNGCVPVAAFYKGMREQGKWQFSESPDYLRELGVLDESDPQNLRVMVPNYLDGLSNCVASSSYYSVCCINECEEILGRIENHVRAPDASPEELARLVALLPSSTVPANRTLSASMLHHLGKIAKAHDGRVPLHSRLFMQWMHNAYPHECPYPHVSGKTSPRLPEVWQAETHKDSTVTLTEMNNFAKQADKLHKSGQCGQWLDQEEMYVPWQTHPLKAEAERDAHAWTGAWAVALITALASMMLMLIQTARALQSAAKKNNKIIMT